MRIALCDKDITLLCNMKGIIYEYAERTKMDILVDCFLSGEELLLTQEKYLVIFLGYELFGKNGLDIARLIAKTENSAPIVFISSNTDFVLEAFKVNTYRFLLSPVCQEDIIGVLDDFFAYNGANYPLWIKNNQDTECINSGDIIYLEANNKHCYIHTANKTLKCRQTMAKVYSVLPHSHFLKTSRAFVANFDYISGYGSDFVSFKNGERIPIGRNYFEQFKKEYKSYANPRIL